LIDRDDAPNADCGPTNTTISCHTSTNAQHTNTHSGVAGQVLELNERVVADPSLLVRKVYVNLKAPLVVLYEWNQPVGQFENLSSLPIRTNHTRRQPTTEGYLAIIQPPRFPNPNKPPPDRSSLLPFHAYRSRFGDAAVASLL
jgi:hypothetical protein